MLKVMFICTANSCRSQMAEGLARELGKGLIESYSAGFMATEVHPNAITVMNEIGIDISKQNSKIIEDTTLRKTDVVITLCSKAEKYCPVLPSEIRHIHWPIRDPVLTRGNEELITNDFRRARDEIKEKIQDFINSLKSEL